MYSKQTGFTLLEMLVVLVIIGLLAGLVGPRFFSHAEGAKVKTANTQIKMIKGALETMQLDIGRFPTEEEGLELLYRAPTDETLKTLWHGPYLDQDLPLDPWNRPYHYQVPGQDQRPFALYSLGADGQPGGSEYNADLGFLPPR